MLHLFILFAFLAGHTNCQFPDNPCPHFFAYKQHRGIYYGEINLPYDRSKILDLAVNISMTGLYQNAKLKLELLTPTDQILSSSVLRYRVNFPFNNVIPKITQITFNGNIYCSGPGEILSAQGVSNLWASLVYKINQYQYTIQSGFTPAASQNFGASIDEIPYNNPFLTNVGPTPSSNVNVPSSTARQEENSCGVSNDIQTLVVNGDKTTDNEYPWLVALFHKQTSSYQFQCTANLISKRHVVTAAHCVWYYKAPLIPKEKILLVIGHSDISHWESTDALIRTALQVNVHPSYQQDSGHCDIAVVRLNEDVTFKPTVRPICLWESDSNLRQIVGSHGMVVGWGKTESNQREALQPRKIQIPVVSQESCLRSHADFKNLTSDMTFCAGNRDGKGPCSGDSGAGFMMKRSGRWYLRGLVSTAIKNQDFSCDLYEYIVFSDVAKLKSWIQSVML